MISKITINNSEIWALNDYSRSMFDNRLASIDETNILPPSEIIEHLDAIQHRLEQLNNKGDNKK